MRNRSIITGVLTALVVAMPTAAWASPPPSSSESDATASLIATVAPDQADPVTPTSSATGGLAADVNGISVAVPDEQTSTVDLTTGDGGSLSVSLPSDVVTSDPEVAQDGTVVYSGAGADLAVQVLADGSTRIASITNDADGPTQFTYSFGQDVQPVLKSDGSVVLTVGTGSGSSISVGSIAPAWARDANGAPVTTRYEVDGGNLVQVIEPSADAVYPIVADPRLTYGFGVYLNGYGYEWKTMQGAMAAAGGAAVVAGCVLVNVPNPWAAILKVACGTIGATNANNFIGWVRTAANSGGLVSSACYQTNMVTKTKLTRVAVEGNCRA